MSEDEQIKPISINLDRDDFVETIIADLVACGLSTEISMIRPKL